MIVLREADVDRAANMAVQWAMSNSGQICIAVERVYVEEPVYDEFVEKVVARTRELRQGAPGEPGRIDVGAMTFPPQMETVRDHVQDAIDKGAQVLVGGKAAAGPGQFFEPTVLTGVDHTMKIMTEETFGPTLPIMKVRDADEAVRLANDSRYGLNSSVFSKDIAKGERVAQAADRGERVRERRADELPRARGPVRWRERVGARSAPRRARDPQVLRHADDPRHPVRSEA